MKQHWVLIQKYLKGKVSDSESEDLEKWLKANPKNRQNFDQIKKVWELSEDKEEPNYKWEEELEKALQAIEKRSKKES